MAATAGFVTLGDLVATFPGRGSAPAIIAFGPESSETVSYDRLHRKIGRVAGGLRERGVGPGDAVLLWAPNSIAWVAAWFGIAESGATAIPADNQYRPGDIAAILNHRGAKLVLTTMDHMAELGDAANVLDADFVLLDADEADPRSLRSLEHAGTPDESSLTAGEGDFAAGTDDASRIASLLYTSGTTGTPKAVPLTHANLAANANALLRTKLIRPHDRVCVPLPFHHTYPFTVGMLTVLGSGAVVVLPSGVSGPELTRATTEAGATALLAVPALCPALWDAIEARVAARGKRAARTFSMLLGASMAVRRTTGLSLGKLFFRPLHKAMLFAIDRLLMRTLFRLRVHGGEHLPDSATPCVIAANHVSFLDPAAIAAALPRRVLRDTHWAAWVGIMFAGPLQRVASRATRVFAVDPDRDLAGAIRTGRAVLAAGQSVVWFPEGRRSHTGELQNFQQGIGVMLAAAPDAQVVPTAISGAYEAWPRHRRLPRPGRVEVVFGRPIAVAELRQSGAGESEAERIANALQQAVARLLPVPLSETNG